MEIETGYNICKLHIFEYITHIRTCGLFVRIRRRLGWIHVDPRKTPRQTTMHPSDPLESLLFPRGSLGKSA
jgi:hypothetical protein